MNVNQTVVQQVREVMKQLLHYWRHRDVDGYLALLDDEVDVVNRAGKWLRGKEEFAAQLKRIMQGGLPEMFTVDYTIDAVRLVHPDVAVVHELRAEPHRQSRAVYTLTRAGSSWRVNAITIAPIETPDK
ncbi:MAG: SgcJ/EcaC family oxidoreductase [Sciscionella sp.]|nr:SgcJ/EcaC family oxidoreductase [Sciscionella sp.]